MQACNSVYIKHAQILKKYQENAEPFFYSDKYRGVQQVIKAIAPKLAQGKLRNILRTLLCFRSALHGMAMFQICIPAAENGHVAVWKYLLVDLFFPPSDHAATAQDP